MLKSFPVLALLLFMFGLPASLARADEDFLALSKVMLIGTDAERRAAADTIIARDSTDMIPSLVLLMRIGGAHVVTQSALKALTGEDLSDWRAAMRYQEANPGIVPHPSYYDLKLWYWGGIDRDFLDLFEGTHRSRRYAYPV